MTDLQKSLKFFLYLTIEQISFPKGVIYQVTGHSNLLDDDYSGSGDTPEEALNDLLSVITGVYEKLAQDSSSENQLDAERLLKEIMP